MAVKIKTGVLMAALLMGCAAVPSFGQAAADNGAAAAPGGGGGGGGGGRRGGGQGGPGGGGAQFRQQMMDRLKADLGSSDDEFAALQPKIDHLMQLQRDARGGGGFGRGGRGGGPGGPGGGGQNGQPQSEVQQKIQELRDALQNKDTPADDIKAKIQAVRDAKAKAKDDLTKSQQELKDLLTQRQEGVMVAAGLLD